MEGFIQEKAIGLTRRKPFHQKERNKNSSDLKIEKDINKKLLGMRKKKKCMRFCKQVGGLLGRVDRPPGVIG